MELLPSEDQCKMMLANKALRQHFVSTMKSDIDEAFENRDESNAALVDDTVHWIFAVCKKPRGGSVTHELSHEFKKLYGLQTPCTTYKSAYSLNMVLVNKPRCVPKRRQGPYSEHAAV